MAKPVATMAKICSRSGVHKKTRSRMLVKARSAVWSGTRCQTQVDHQAPQAGCCDGVGAAGVDRSVMLQCHANLGAWRPGVRAITWLRCAIVRQTMPAPQVRANGGGRTQGQAPAPELPGSGKHELSAPSGAEEKDAGLWVLRQSIRGLIISRAGVFLNHAKRRC